MKHIRYDAVREQYMQIEDIHQVINKLGKKKDNKAVIKQLERVLDISISQLKVIAANDVTGQPGIRKRNVDVAHLMRGSYHNPFNLKAYIVCLDIDHFGRFNKKHGDLEGDKILKLVADSLNLSLRSEDVVLNLGERWDGNVFREAYHLHGDEFQLILMTPNSRYAAIAVKRCKDHLVKYVQEKSKHKIGVSIGFVEWDIKKDTFTVAEGKAIKSRNLAKKKGRNKVVYRSSVV